MVSPKKADDRMRELRTWLTDDGWSVKGVVDEQNHQNFEFSAGNDVYHLVHPNPHAESAGIISGLDGGPLNKALEGEDPEEIDDFLWDIRLRLIELGVEFQGIEYPAQKIVIHVPVYFDGTTRESFFNKQRKVKNATYLLQWVLKSRFDLDDPPGPSPDSPNYIQ